MKFEEKEFETLINKMMDKKEKMSGREFVKLVFLSGWDTGKREFGKKEIKFLEDCVRNTNSVRRKLKQRIKELEAKQ